MIVGVTGGIGSGKTTVVKMFSNFKNVAIYLADDEAKKIMNTSLEIKEKLTQEFSEEVYQNGALNRSFLATIVFKDEEKLKKLNAIVHPLVHKHLESFIKENANKEYIIYENAILFENGSDRLCDKVITVTAPSQVKINRVISRDKITEKEVKSRMNSQWPDFKKILQSNYVIYNENLENTQNQVLKIHKKLTQT